jgi:cytochrome P450
MMTTTYPPGPQGHILLGNLLQLRNNRLQFVQRCSRQYGDIVHLRAGPITHIYLLNHPTYIHDMLVGCPEKYHKTPMLRNNASKVLGQGLLISEDDFHKTQRRLVQPAFHHARVASYGEVTTRHTLQMLDEWKPGQIRNLYNDMMKLTLGIVSEALFGASVSDNAEKIGQAIALGMQLFHERLSSPLPIPDWMPTARNRKWHEAAEFVEQTILHIIDNRRRSGEDNGDLLSMLLLAVDEYGTGRMTAQQARDEVMTLFIAGHETTAIGLSWVWCLLAQRPEVAAKLYDELDQVLGGRVPTTNDLIKLPYTEMVIKEGLRLYPPSWTIGRQAIEDVQIGDYMVPHGSLLFASPYIMQRDPRYFDQPDAFIPDRFAENLEKRLPRYVYFPFGAGPRVCIGQSFAMQESCLILATIAQRFRWTLTQEVMMDPILTMRPQGGVSAMIAAR